MSQTSEAVSLALMEFKLANVPDVTDQITASSYGSHVLAFLRTHFGVTFETALTKIDAAGKIWTEVLVSQDGKIVISMRLYDRQRDFLLTLNLDIASCDSGSEDNYNALSQFCERERAELSGGGQPDKGLAPDQETANCLPIISRGTKYSPYYQTSDNRFCQYNVKSAVYDVRSRYQHVQILDTVDAGKLLVLDGYANLGESDTVGYTHALMDLSNEVARYADSRVLILGGGDGALLKELLELPEPPGEIVMIELDEAVMVGCSEHMRSVCGDHMDAERRNGPNYRVVTGDAIDYMEKAKERGEKYDYVFGDLTDTPVDADETEANANIWKFLLHILDLGMNLIKPETGKYLTHYNGKSATQQISKYEDILLHLRVDSDPSLKCHFTRSESFVQSFQEIWVFYQISMRRG